MRFFKDKKFRELALDRAIRTVFQSLGSTIPVGLVITPSMINRLHWNIIEILIAWILTALVAGFTSLCTSIAKGIPEYNEDDELEEKETIDDSDDGKIE